MDKTCEYLRQRVDRVASEWASLATKHHWLVNGERYATASATRMVLALVEAAVCEQRRLDSHLAKVRVTAEYAAYCREAGIDLAVVSGKFALLREAFWVVLNEEGGLDPETRLQVILWIDAAFSLVTRAALLGYHKADLVARGLWPEIVDSLARESPLIQR